MAQVISESEWVEIFGGLGPSNATVMDLWYKVDALYTAWQKLTSKDDESGSATSERLERPVVYAAALILEFYDAELLVPWFANALCRYVFMSALVLCHA